MTDLPPVNEEAETSVLGALLLSDKPLDSIAADIGLRPHHFYRETNRQVFAAMLALRDRGAAIDVLTVSEELDGDEAVYVHSLPNLVPSASNVRHYAGIVKKHATMRRKLQAARDIQQAIHDGDEDAVRHAEATLMALDQHRGGVVLPDELGRRLQHRSEHGVSAWPLPFKGLNRRLSGGLQPGNVTLLGAWTHHGKTAFAFQILIGIAELEVSPVCRVVLTTDSTAEEAAARVVAHRTGIPLSRILQGDIREIERKDFDEARQSIPFPIVEAYGWSAQEIAHDIRRAQPDVVLLDMLHGIAYDDERDLRRISQTFNNLARETGTHIIATVHLNDGRNLKDSEPMPVMRDVKGASSLRQDANNVLFVWRENASGSIKNAGHIQVAKARGGVAGGGVPVEFDGPTLTFKEV